MSQTTPVSLCVEIARAQASSERGHAAQWTVSAWSTGGIVPDASIKLQATPASGGAPGFSFGCGNAAGTSSCDLGTVDSKSAPRQLQAQLTVPVTASTITSVSLAVTGSAADLAKDPEAAATESITAPPTPTTTPQSQTPPQNPAAPQDPVGVPSEPDTVTSALPVGVLPSIPDAGSTLSPVVGSTLSPGGNAAGLFPTVNPTPSTGLAQSNQKEHTRPVADTSALPEGAPVIGAQLAGLAALALAFVLAITRLTIRRRPAAAKATPDAAAAATPPQEAPETPPEPAEQQQASDDPPADPPAASGDVKPDA
ncbi:MAG: hypothetical protein ACRDNO_15070 [Trebonia sp.]